MPTNRHGESDGERYRLRTLLWRFATAKETKEIYVGHGLIIALSAIAYLFGGKVWGVLTFAGGMMLEMVFFHVLWIYRENRDEREHPIVFAIGVEVANIVMGILGLVALTVLAVAVYYFFGIPLLYTYLVIGVGGFSLYTGYKIREALRHMD